MLHVIKNEFEAPLDQIAAQIKAHVVKGDASEGKAEEHYKAAGLYLIDARKRLPKSMTWSGYVFGHCKLDVKRAEDLIALADGSKTMAEIRAAGAEAFRKHAEKERGLAKPRRRGPPKKGSEDETRLNLTRKIRAILRDLSVPQLEEVLETLESEYGE